VLAVTYLSVGRSTELKTVGTSLIAFCVLLVCLCADLRQITKTRLCTVQHRLNVSAVHLAGSSILTRIHSTVSGTGQREHNSNVLMHALSDPAVSLLIGTTAAGYMTSHVNVFHTMPSRSFLLSDNVIYTQVHNVTTHLQIYFHLLTSYVLYIFAFVVL